MVKFNYFGYSLVNSNDRGKKHLFDVRGVLRNFARLDSPIYKNGFKYLEDNLYLFESSADCYLFIMTRNKEMIKKVDTKKIGVAELTAELAKEGSSVGFASFIMMDKHHFAMGTTTLSPRIDVYACFINQILVGLGVPNYEFVPRAFTHKSSKKDVVDMPIIGRSVIEIQNSPSGSLQRLANALTGRIVDISELEGLEVIFKPKNRNSNIKEVVTASLDNMDELSKAFVRAKEDAKSNLKDLYLTSEGVVFDVVNGIDDHEIFSKIKAKSLENILLLEKVKEFANDKIFRSGEISSLVCLNNFDSWSALAINLQMEDQ